MKFSSIRIFIYFLTFVLIGSAFISCSDDEPVIESFDDEAPNFVSVTPGDSSTDVSVSTVFSVSFDESMHPETIYFSTEDDDCEGSLQVSDDGFQSCVQMSRESFSYNPDKQTFFVSPQTPLNGFTTYRVRITNDAKDLALNRLAEEFEMTNGFTTGSGDGGPTNNAQNIYFGDENTIEGKIRGYLNIERAADETGITNYILYWGSSDSQRMDGMGPIKSFSVSEEKLEHYFGDMDIPENATHFLVYSTNSTGESASPTYLYIPDAVVRMAADICPGDSTSDSNPKEFAEYNGKLFFSANGCDNKGEELWVFDSYNEFAQRVTDIAPDGANSSPGEKVAYNGRLYFPAQGSVGGVELWWYNDFDSTDGMLPEINGSGSSFPGELTVFNKSGNDILYFRATDGGSMYGEEIWYYDGSTVDIAVDITMDTGDSSSDALTVFGDRIYFAANMGGGNNELWWYDGTTSTTIQGTNYDKVTSLVFIPFPPLGGEFYEYNNNLYFRADDYGNGVEPWYYGGGIDVYNLDNIFPGGTSESSEPKWFMEYNGRLYFQAQDTTDNRELWVYDDTMMYPERVMDVDPAGQSLPSYLTEFQGMLVFSARNNNSGFELFGYSDYGEYNEIFVIADINPGPSPNDSNPEFLTKYNGRLYFVADDGLHGRELWVFYVKSEMPAEPPAASLSP